MNTPGPRIRYQSYGPGEAEQPQPGDQVIGLPNRFGRNTRPWWGARPELMRDRSLSWLGGVVVGPISEAGTYEVMHYYSDRVQPDPNAYHAPGRVALRWDEMIHVVIENIDIPNNDGEPA